MDEETLGRLREYETRLKDQLENYERVREIGVKNRHRESTIVCASIGLAYTDELLTFRKMFPELEQEP